MTEHDRESWDQVVAALNDYDCHHDYDPDLAGLLCAPCAADAVLRLPLLTAERERADRLADQMRIALHHLDVTGHRLEAARILRAALSATDPGSGEPGGTS